MRKPEGVNKELENRSEAGDIKKKERADGRYHMQAGMAATKDKDQK